MMDTKTNWKDTDCVNVDDFNRIRLNLAQLSGDGVYQSPVIVDASYVISADDILELRLRYEMAAQDFGVLSDYPNGTNNPHQYESFDPMTIGDIFPRLLWLCNWKGDYNFPAAWELNLYERLCEYIEQNTLRQRSVLRAGGVLIVSETITLST